MLRDSVNYSPMYELKYFNPLEIIFNIWVEIFLHCIVFLQENDLKDNTNLQMIFIKEIW